MLHSYEGNLIGCVAAAAKQRSRMRFVDQDWASASEAGTESESKQYVA